MGSVLAFNSNLKRGKPIKSIPYDARFHDYRSVRDLARKQYTPAEKPEHTQLALHDMGRILPPLLS
jgi:hypothetical protein